MTLFSFKHNELENNFYFRLFPGKTNDKIFQKIQKITSFGPLWAHFAHFRAQQKFTTNFKKIWGADFKQESLSGCSTTL